MMHDLLHGKTIKDLSLVDVGGSSQARLINGGFAPPRGEIKRIYVPYEASLHGWNFRPSISLILPSHCTDLEHRTIRPVSTLPLSFIGTLNTRRRNS
jgi:hypothetical protein